MSPHTIGGGFVLDQQPDTPDGGGFNLRDLIPDDSPPWLIALGVVLTFLLLTSLYWGPPFGAWLRSLVPTPREKEVEPDRPDDTVQLQPTSVPTRAPAADRVDAGMAVIQRMVDDQAEHVRALMAENEQREADLREQVRINEQNTAELREQVRQNGELRIQLAGAEGRIAVLQGYVDRLLEQRAGPPA